MQKTMMTKEEVKALIEAGKTLLLAGSESLLADLPKGRWIGGTIPYFMGDEGGTFTESLIQVHDISAYAEAVTCQNYDEHSIDRVFTEAPDNGFSVIILPFRAPVHFSFAINAPNFEQFAMRPLIGWVCGGKADDLDAVQPRTFCAGACFADQAVVMHVTLPASKIAEVGIANPFEPGEGDVLQFPADGFSAKTVLVNGQESAFVDYIRAKQLDTRLPLVADYFGAYINVCIGKVTDQEVQFFAPVFQGIEYRHAMPIADYKTAFEQVMPQGLSSDTLAFSCNCILNYLYLGLEGKTLEPFRGPVTFGEIAYQLLNQTLVYLTVYNR